MQEDTALLRDGGSGWGYSVPSVGVALAGRGGGKAGSGAAAQRAASDSAPLKSSKAGAVDDDDEVGGPADMRGGSAVALGGAGSFNVRPSA